MNYTRMDLDISFRYIIQTILKILSVYIVQNMLFKTDDLPLRNYAVVRQVYIFLVMTLYFFMAEITSYRVS